MAPIRVALIGLSRSAKTSWAADAHIPYLLSDRGRSKYQIVALLNSSVDAAKGSIAAYGLEPSIRAYGSPADLAADPDVDLVVCTTRVDVHYPTVKPVLEAGGKDVFVEWPVAENASRAADLVALAQKKGVRTLVGLQGRLSPPVQKVKEVVHSEIIGKVVSSTITAYSRLYDRGTYSEGLAYFTDLKVGGNPVTIAFAHLIDSVHSVLGEYESFQAHTQIQNPNVIVLKNDGTKAPITSDVPDLVSVHGPLYGSEHVVKGASLVAQYRSGAPFKDTPPLVWTIVGEKGSIRLTSAYSPFLQSEAPAQPVDVEVEIIGIEQVKKLEWGWEDWQAELQPARGRSIAKIYDLYADGKDDALIDFEAAVARHRQIDAILGVLQK